MPKVIVMTIETISATAFVGYPIRRSLNALIVDLDVGALLIENNVAVYEGGNSSARPKIIKQKRHGNWPKMQAVDRWLMSAKKGQVVCHRNGDLYDCRRENMEVVEKNLYMRTMVRQKSQRGALEYQRWPR
jgi:hypothetical protein